MIAAKTGADSFEIKPVKPYPQKYKECTDLAKAELNAARSDLAPALGWIEDIAKQYATATP